MVKAKTDMIRNKNFFSDENFCRVIRGSLAVMLPKDYRNMPLIKKQNVDAQNIKYIGFQNIRKTDDRDACAKTVGFFLPDKKFECVCNKPWEYSERLLQYKQVMSPDVSCYTDMPLEEQWYNTYLNRLIGKYWQSCGLVVIPTVSWSDKRSYGFAFAGIEQGCVVAVSTIGTKNNYDLFLRGFAEMCEKIKPAAVLCYCRPYDAMYEYTNIVYIEYEGRQPWREARLRPDPNQLTLFDFIDLQEAM